MKHIFIITLLLLISNIAFTQVNEIETYYLDNNSNNTQQVPGINNSNYKSSNGSDIPTKGTLRSLSILINIIYDQNDTIQNYINAGTFWQPDITSSINQYVPTNLQSLFNVNASPTYNYNGIITRLYAESSFNKLVILGDFMVVNIKQSQITPYNPGANFTYIDLMTSVVNYINSQGGLNTVYLHNNPIEYDKLSFGTAGLEKYFVSNTKIDIVNFLTRNTIYLKDMNGNVYLNYGNVRSGQGYSGKGLGPDVGININGVSYKYDFGTYQCIGGGDLTVSKKNIWGHELAHLFLGGNNFHTSGGNHVGTDETNTFIGIQGGYGLFNGGLISCNGFERWRLGWQFDINNINMISSNNQNSDIISKFTGEQTFTMRDFVTYGDVIRIKLPYKDSENASNQYIWLENHQCGKNGKFDGYVYNDIKPCRSVDKAGVYSYYQVGKDIIESTIPKQVYPDNEKDNLRIISAEGNYNVNFLGYTEDCLNFCGGSCRPLFEYTTPNSFHGVNPQTEVISPDLSKSTLDYKSTHKYMGSKIKNGIPYNNLPSCGSDLDAFIPTQTGILMDLSSNPAAVNTTTYYSVQYKHQNYITQTTIWDFYSVDNYRNTKKIYLSGLSIKMIDPDPANTGMKAYTVKVRWDDYDIKQNVNWAGDIVSKEQINLLQGKTISLEQNLTPCQIEKDPVSGVFAPPTRLTCEPNSILTMNEYSKIVLKEKSSIILQSSSSNTIKDGAIIEIQNGSTLQIKSGANLNILGSGKIVVKSGGYICVESGATINLQDYNSLIVLEEGASYGANPLLFTSPSCSSTITKTGNGAIADFNQDVYIQNRTISTSQYFGGKNIYVGNHVTTSQTGDVIINNNANVIFDCKTTTFDCGFECVVGSTYEVKNH